MDDKNKQALFETMPIPQAAAKLIVPTVISSMVMILYNLADTYFVGCLNDPIQNSAVTLAAPVILAFTAVTNLFGVGSSSMMSRALGTGDYDTVRRSSAFGIYCSILCAILFSLVYTLNTDVFLRILGADASTSATTAQYMFWTVSCGAVPAIANVVLGFLVRAEGSALSASIGTMSGCLLNIVLDPIFIMPWGFGMGVSGAGCATFISNCVSCCYFFIYIAIKRGKSYVCMKPAMARCGKAVALGVFAVGIPAAIQNLLNVTGMTILNNFTAGYGSNAVAAMGIAQKIQMVPIYMAMGFSNGIMPLVGYNYSSGNFGRMKEAVRFTVKLDIVFLIAIAAVYISASEQLVMLFIKNAEVVKYGSAFLCGIALALPFAGMDFLGVGVFQACGMGKSSLLFAVLRKVVLEIPALFILNKLVPLYGIAYAQLTAELVLCAAAVIVLRKIFAGLEKEKPEKA